jgi:nucleoside phosphorylase
MHLLVCFALKEEAASFRKMAAGTAAAAQAASILITGIGRRNAEKSLREFLATNSPKLVLTCGFAGGLNPDLAIGTVVFELPESPLSTFNFQLSTRLSAAGVKPVRFFCADRITTTVAEKKKLRAETGADAVEMESETIHAVCRERGISCATVRVISDMANEDLPLDFNAFSKPDMSLDYGKLAWAITKSPGKIGALLKLRKQTRFAAKQLAAVLAKTISQ